MSTNSFHFRVATNGLRSCNHKIFALSGFKCNFEVVVPPFFGGGGVSTGTGWPADDKPIKLPKRKPNDPRPIIVRVTIKDKTTEKTFMVRPKRLRYIVAVANILNSIMHKISVGVNYITQIGKS